MSRQASVLLALLFTSFAMHFSHKRSELLMTKVCSTVFSKSKIILNIFQNYLDTTAFKTKQQMRNCVYSFIVHFQVREMFYFGYNNYMTHAFPMDELNPHQCNGRGPDYENPENININDVLGNFSLGLVDSLDTLAIMGDSKYFKSAINQVIKSVSFDQECTVQVFESTIRMLGSLLSSHLIITEWTDVFNITMEEYDNELLSLAHDLGVRLLPAFENSDDMPIPRVHLRHGKSDLYSDSTCTAGVGTLILEFKMLGRLVGDPVFEIVAERAMDKLWNLKDSKTGLIGNVYNTKTGSWEDPMSGIGAGIDSYFEYLLKSFILFGNEKDLARFSKYYSSIARYMKRFSIDDRNLSVYDNPYYFANVHMNTGKLHNHWIDSLSAAFIGVQILHGDLEAAILHHAFFYGLWLKYDALPERYNWYLKKCEYALYPLRPEFAEATYLLYRATRHPFYLFVGEKIYNSIQMYNKAKCGYATLNSVLSKKQEDRMESFFLSETCKYLYLLFDQDNPLNKRSDFIFTTEGHLMRINRFVREKMTFFDHVDESSTSNNISHLFSCEAFPRHRQMIPPFSDEFWSNLVSFIDLKV